MEMESSSSSSSVIILYPSPEIGHLVSIMELGKLIQTNHPSLSVIILVLPASYETGSIDTYMKTVTATTTTTLTFHHLPVIPLPPEYSDKFLDLPLEIPELYNKVVYNTLVSILQKSTIKAVILDFFSNAAFQVTKSLDIPTYYFFTSSTSGLCSFLHIPTLHKTYTKSFKDLDAFINIPGILPIHSSCMPKPLIDRESISYKHFLKTSINMVKSCGVITNSFFELEERAAQALRDGKLTDATTPPIYFIGPLVATGNIKAENDTCLKWLNTQPSKSVVLLCFGSMGVLKKQQLKEIAVGLERSGQRFLWVVRKPPSEEDEGSGTGTGTVTEYKDFDLDDVLPQGFLVRTRDKGLVVKNWAPQLPILGHESVSGFVSHCGWNSVLEAVVSGVPIVAWPLYAEQKLNRMLLVEEMKIALWLKMSPVDGFVSAESVEETVRQLMEGEEERPVRQRMLEMSKKAKAALDEAGSSRVDFFKLTGPWTHV